MPPQQQLGVCWGMLRLFCCAYTTCLMSVHPLDWTITGWQPHAARSPPMQHSSLCWLLQVTILKYQYISASMHASFQLIVSCVLRPVLQSHGRRLRHSGNKRLAVVSCMSKICVGSAQAPLQWCAGVQPLSLPLFHKQIVQAAQSPTCTSLMQPFSAADVPG